MGFNSSQSSKSIRTRLLYLENQHELSARGIIVECSADEGGDFMIVPDRTPMYMRRGGQPSDTGVIDGDGFSLVVRDIRPDAHGRARHIGQLIGQRPAVGESIKLTADASIRELHSLWHSAGEAVIVAAKMAGFDRPVRGAIHYGPSQNRIEYSARMEREEAELLREQIQANLVQLVQDDTPIRSYDLRDRQEVIEKCGFWPDYVKDDEAVRVIQVHPAYTGRPCTGTHLARTGELGQVIVDRVRVKGDRTIVSYGCGER